MSSTVDEKSSVVSQQPLVNAVTINRGSMASTDLTAARPFYEEFLGLECVRTAADRMFVRIPANGGGKERRTGDYCLIEVHQTNEIQYPQNVLNHWGIDVPTREDVDRIHAAAHKYKDKYGLRRIMKVRMQHGVYGFYFEDRDFNWWEIEQRDAGRTHAPLFMAGDKYPD